MCIGLISWTAHIMGVNSLTRRLLVKHDIIAVFKFTLKFKKNSAESQEDRVVTAII